MSSNVPCAHTKLLAKVIKKLQNTIFGNMFFRTEGKKNPSQPTLPRWHPAGTACYARKKLGIFVGLSCFVYFCS